MSDRAPGWSTLHRQVRSALDACRWPAVDELVDEVLRTPDPETPKETLYAVMTLRRVLRAVSERGTVEQQHAVGNRLMRCTLDAGLDPVVDVAATIYKARLRDDRRPALLLVEQFVENGMRHRDGRRWTAEAVHAATQPAGTLSLERHIEAHAVVESIGHGIRAINERVLSCPPDEVEHLANVIDRLRSIVPPSIDDPDLARTEATPNLYWHLGCTGVFESGPTSLAERYLNRAVLSVQETPLQRATFAPLRPIQIMLYGQLARQQGHSALAAKCEDITTDACAAADRNIQTSGLSATRRRFEQIIQRLLNRDR